MNHSVSIGLDIIGIALHSQTTQPRQYYSSLDSTKRVARLDLRFTKHDALSWVLKGAPVTNSTNTILQAILIHMK